MISGRAVWVKFVVAPSFVRRKQYVRMDWAREVETMVHSCSVN
jgi:uncharacterized protein Usg